jgi:MFS family permease
MKTSCAPPLRSKRADGRHSGVFYGWWVVLTSAVGLFWGVPISVYSFSVFLRPLMQEFHASRAAISLAFTVHLIAAAIAAPFVGWLIDRYGSRRVVLVGTAMFGLILLGNKAFAVSIRQLYFYYALLGMALHGVGPIPYGDVVCHWFDRRRGLALGLTMLGIGSGAMIIPSLAQQLIARFGWSNAYAILGAAVLLVAMPVVAAFLREKPQDLGIVADGMPGKDFEVTSEGSCPGLSAAHAWRTGTFWLMLCAFFLVSASVQGCLVHIAAMFHDRGMTLQTSALASSLAGAAVMIGRVGTGYLLDRLFAPRLAAAFFGAASLGIGMLGLGSPLIAFAGAFLVGLGLGAEVDLIAYLTSRYFGLRTFGKIYSWIFAAFGVAGALGPLMMGAGFDRTGSYRGPLIVFLAATLLACLLITRLGPYRYRASKSHESDQKEKSVTTPALHQPPTPERFFSAINAYQLTEAITCAIELEIFTAIAEGNTTPATIAHRCLAAERGGRILCDFLTIHEFLTKHGMHYALATDSALFLNRRSRAYAGAAIDFLLAPQVRECHAQLTEAVRRGGTALGEGTPERENPDWVKCAKGMMPMVHKPSEIMAAELRESGEVHKVLDVAASHGIFGISVARLNPAAHIDASDWKNVLEVAQKKARSMGVAERYHLLSGSAFETDFGGGYDLALITNFLHRFDVPTCTNLMTNVHGILSPGGRAAIAEFVTNRDCVSPPTAAAFSLMMPAVTPSGDAHTFAELENISKNAGVERVELVAPEIGRNRLVVACR